MQHDISCRFRHEVRLSDGKEYATCGLLQKILNDDEPDVCKVERDACVACSRVQPTTSDLVGLPFASILSNACDQKLLQVGESSSQPSPAAELAQAAEDSFLEASVAPQLATCDVILWCERVDQFAYRAIDSILKQTGVAITLNFVVPSDGLLSEGSQFAELIERYQFNYDFALHAIPQSYSSLSALQVLAPRLRSEFVTIQCCNSISLPNRISAAVSEMRRLGADFIGSPMDTPTGRVEIAEQDLARSAAVLPWQTLVIRRASFIDLGGISEPEKEAEEFLSRAKASGAKTACLPWPTVELLSSSKNSVNVKSSPHDPSLFESPQCAFGFPSSFVACDVVLPVYGQLDFVRPAIESVIEQENAEAVIHMIDDCGPEDTSELFRYWGSHSQVRLYRNTRNIGQYTSFNNVSEYFETDLVAVQDGDDISLPNRLSVSGNLLELSGAEYFAAAMEQFGTAEELPIRRSGYPSRKNSPYFAMNPTACFRVSMFRSLGGYADFGAHERNRGGLDTEFMNRAYWSHRRFAISNSIVTRRRVHAEAATQRSDTGFGSSLRNQAIRETHRRIALMRMQAFDPRYFGGLGNHRQLTERVT